MASKVSAFEGSVAENKKRDLKRPEGFKTDEKFKRASTKLEEEGDEGHDENFDENASQHSRVPCKEFRESKNDQLFEYVPELKEAFVIQSKIGEGTFSNVYLAHLVDYPDEMFALKHIIPTSSPDRVEREVRCLQEMGGENNVIGYKGTIRHHDHNVIILPYFPHDRFQDYLHKMSVSDIQEYMKNLLLALKHIHSFSIIHRDIKPGNFLHSRKSGRYNLVDFGLAMHEPNAENAWEIEKKNDKYKSSNGKNARQLSPESLGKNSQVNKKPRTSPRVAVTSHKLARQATKGNRASDVSSKHKNRSVKFVSPSNKEKQLDGKSSTLSSKSGSGLCQTKHKTYEICSLCMKRATQSAPRAGTSGFRAPEVLLKYPQQTTAVDVWSAGIIMLCLLSGKYPFFRCMDDMTALAQIITVFGKQRVVECTKALGKYMASNSMSPGYELRDLCQRLRASNRKDDEGSFKKCCTSCNRHLANESTGDSPGSNLQRINLRKRDGRSKADVEGNNEDTISSKKSKDGDPKKESAAQFDTSQKDSVNKRLESEFADLRPNSVSDAKSHTSKEKTKVRNLSEGSRRASYISDDCSVVQTGSGTPREHLDGSRCTCDCGSCPEFVPVSAYHLLERCLDLNPWTRITASDALAHPFFQEYLVDSSTREISG